MEGVKLMKETIWRMNRSQEKDITMKDCELVGEREQENAAKQR